MSVSSINRGEYSNTFAIIKKGSSQGQFELCMSIKAPGQEA